MKLKKKYCQIILLSFLCILSGTTLSSECSDFNLKYSRPAYAKIESILVSYSNEPANNSVKQLEYYKKLSGMLLEIKTLKEGIKGNFRKSCIGRGGLAENAYYIRTFDLAGQFVGSVPYELLQRISNEKKQPLPDIINNIIEITELRLSQTKAQIDSQVALERKKEENRKVLLDSQYTDIEELENLVHENMALKTENDNKESNINERKKSSHNEAPRKVENQRKVVNQNNSIDKLTTYAVILGRATACDINADREFAKVGKWMDSVFPPGTKEQRIYLPIFLEGTKYHMQEQLAGNSPDNCSSIESTFNTFPWP